MPAKPKGARLYLEPERRTREGKLHTSARWIIRDGEARISTGCAEGEVGRAEAALAEYLKRKHEAQLTLEVTAAQGDRRAPADVPIADVLSLYVDHKSEDGLASLSDMMLRVGSLNDWWGNRPLSSITILTCREYLKHRLEQPNRRVMTERTGTPPKPIKPASVRRELEDLQAAVNYHRKCGLCTEVVSVWLPPKAPPKTAYLTETDAAKLLWAMWTMREAQKRNRKGENAGPAQPTKKYTGRHLARFLLVGLYTGTRASAICAASFWREPGRSWVDVDRGLFYRLADGQQETKKRQPPVRILPRLLAHLRRWKAQAEAERALAHREHREPRFGNAVVEWQGQPIKSVRKGFASAALKAGLDPKIVTPHILRHTAATWMMQRGKLTVWDAAGILGMTVEVLERHYGHHRPDFQQKLDGAFK